MIRWSYPILALFILVVLGFGLLLTIKEDLEVAGLKHKGNPEKGRMVKHLKNATFIAGSTEGVFKKVSEAVQYEVAETAGFVPNRDNWKEFVKKSIRINPDARHILVLPSKGEESIQWALPSIFYAKHYGSPVVFDDEIENYTASFFNKKTFITAPERLISNEALGKIKDYERISAADPAELAVKIARYRDKEAEFGWGREHHRRTGYFQYVVTTPSEALNGLAALALAKSNAASLLYANDKGGIPAITDNYIWSQRADWFVTPSEGPFRHFWIASGKLSYTSIGRFDFSVEKSSYPDFGDVALGPMEAIAIIFIVLGIAGAIFIFIHSSYTLPSVMLPVKIAWALGAMLLPILGIILYFSAYRRPVYKKNNTVHWLRPQNIQSAAATMMGFGYGAPSMIAIAYLFAFFGFPIFFTEAISETIFWLGAGMPFMMIVMFVAAIIIVALMIQYPMKASMMDMPGDMVLWDSVKVTFLSMAAVSLGMMTFVWWMMMSHLPMMPKEDDIMWFGTVWFASFTGFLIAWPLNWVMVSKKIKDGSM